MGKRGLKLKYGVGINDADYPIFDCIIYRKWDNMLNRCYSEKSLARRPSYQDCFVESSWLTFSNFKQWYEENYIEDYELDKDLLVVGNREYSKDTCIFIPRELNSVLNVKTNRKHSSELPVGVIIDSHKLNRGDSQYLRVKHGSNSCSRYFSCPIEANEFYRDKRVKQLSKFLGQYGDRIDQGITNHINELKNPSKDSIYVVRR